MKAIYEFLLLYTLVFTLVLLLSPAIGAQTTYFTYQGRLSESGLSANGTYDIQFALFDTASGGSQIGSTETNAAVSVVNGIFTVNLDFGQGAFSGPERFLQIAVRAAGNPNPHTLLTPRQPVTSAPYSIRSLNADMADTATDSNQLGGIDADQYVTGQVVRSVNNLADNVTLAAGSNITITPAGNTLTIASTGGGSGGILNQTNLQSGANFNIGGTGSANVFNADDQYNIGGSRVFSVGGVHNSFVGINAGGNNVTGVENSFFGFNAGLNQTSGHDNVFVGSSAGFNNISGTDNTFIGRSSGTLNKFGDNNTMIGSGANVVGDSLQFATALGAGSSVSTNNTIALGRTNGSDKVRIFGLGAAGSTQLCRNSSNEIATCSSSLRYKENIASFNSGLNLINRLKPITFDWKDGGMKDLGLGAEDVVGVEPLLVNYNDKGEVEGVKYDRIGVVLVNAVKEQQTQIDIQQKQIQQQQLTIDGLKKLVCRANALAEECREEK